MCRDENVCLGLIVDGWFSVRAMWSPHKVNLQWKKGDLVIVVPRSVDLQLVNSSDDIYEDIQCLAFVGDGLDVLADVVASVYSTECECCSTPQKCSKPGWHTATAMNGDQHQLSMGNACPNCYATSSFVYRVV